MQTLQQEIKSIGDKVYYQNPNLTSKNFPKPKKIRTENYKFITIPKSYSSQEALEEIKKQGCTPANIWELTELAKQGKLEKGNWYVAFGQTWTDSDGYHRVPFVFAHSDGDFRFLLGFFESDWDSGHVLLCFCDLSSDTQNLKNSDTLFLPDELIINNVKYVKDK